MSERTGAIEKKALEPVTKDERQHWTGIAFIWIGTMICIPMLMVGAMIVSGLTLGSTIAVAAIGFAICCIIMCLTGMVGTDLGYPVVMCASKSFGDSGARIIVSLVVAIAQFGWFGVQTATCGLAFCELMAMAFNIAVPFWLSALIWGIVMLTTAVFGFRFMKILNYIAVPTLLLLCIYGVVNAINTFGMSTLTGYQPPQMMPVLSAISIMIGLFAVGTVISSDYTRYSKSRADTIKSCVLGVLPAAIAMITAGAIMSLVAGEYDITKVFASTGHPMISMLVLILATWTTNTGNAYTAGLAVMRLFSIKDSRRPVVTAICGFLGTILAMIGVMTYFSEFLNLLAAAIPPIAGVLIADYWLVGRGKKEKWYIISGFNWCGVASWIGGTLIALFASFFSQALDSILTAIVLYLLLNMVFGKKNITDMETQE
jgi:cytosine permease